MRVRSILAGFVLAITCQGLIAAQGLAAQELDLTNAANGNTYTVSIGTVLDLSLQNPSGGAPNDFENGVLHRTSLSGNGNPYVATFLAVGNGTNPIQATAPCAGSGCSAALAFIVTIHVKASTAPTPVAGVGEWLTPAALALAAGGMLVTLAARFVPPLWLRPREPGDLHS